MQRLCRLYCRLCKRFGPDGLTLSAFAWKHRSRWVRVIDAMFSQPEHCRRSFERETASTPGN